MKKILFVLIIFSFLTFTPKVSAQTSIPTDVRIAQIKAQIEALTTELTLLQGLSSATTLNVEVGNIFSQKVKGVIQNSIKIRIQSPTEIYIPFTTTDSPRNGLIGMGYSLIGDEFVGEQSSKVSCGKRKKINNVQHCIVAANKQVEFTYRVDLDSLYTGNYGVSFDQITYLKDGKYAQHKIIGAKSNLVFIGLSD